MINRDGIAFVDKNKKKTFVVNFATHFPITSSMSPRDGDTPRILPLQLRGCNSSAGNALSMYARYA